MDTLPTEIMFFASLLLSLGNRLISLGNCGGIAQKDERSYCNQDITALLHVIYNGNLLVALRLAGSPSQ
jgi:hypothetical protein